MPLNPLWAPAIRRRWPVFGAIGALAILLVADQVWFQPTLRRHQAALHRAEELGMAVDPNHVPAALPPRLFALLTDNSLPEPEAQERGNSGALTAELLADLTDLASRHGMEALITEPGPVTQQKQSVVVRAHMRLRCRYDQFVAMLAEMARGRTLLAVDRFAFSGGSSGSESLDLWVSRLVLKQSKDKV